MVKQNILIGILILISFVKVGLAQIPNAGFENWDDDNPVYWFTSNLQRLYTPVTKSNDAHKGLYAVEGNVLISPIDINYPPSLAAGPYGVGIPINFRPSALYGWYKYFTDTDDVLSVSVAVTKNGKEVGDGIFLSTGSCINYTEFKVNIVYRSEEIPDTALILIIPVNINSIQVGSRFIVDDLSFSTNRSEIEMLSKDTVDTEVLYPLFYKLEQNYPNPFNPTTNIRYQVAGTSNVNLKIYDVLGNEIILLVNETKEPGTYEVEFDGSSLSTGIYLYKLTAGNFSAVKKFLLMK